MGISDHLGKPKTFSNDCLVTETQKKESNAAFPNCLRERKDQVFII